MRALTIALALASAAGAQAQPQPPTCGNGTCELFIEGCRNCPQDCGVCQSFGTGYFCGSAQACGHGTDKCFCDAECVTHGDCCLDVCLHCSTVPFCGAAAITCGDGLCGAGETCDSCPDDCGACPTCGDQACDVLGGPNSDPETCDNCAVDCGACCGNGLCEADRNEDCASCDTDCGPCSSDTCGNGVCDPGENSQNCPPDCPVKCGDGGCDKAYESCSSCEADCGPCPGGSSESCEGKCGQNNDTCWCDAYCHLYGDCCPDVCTFCGELPKCASCGDGKCAPGECNTCPADCTSWCAKCGDGVCQKTQESCSTCPDDCGSCCGNGSCDPGEDSTGCPADCPPCGDGTCSGNESCHTCVADCGSCCGNGNCENSLYGETCENCPGDCGACLPTGFCGDGLCKNEDCGSCPEDCCTCTNLPPVSAVPNVAPPLLAAAAGATKLEIVFPFPGGCDAGEIGFELKPTTLNFKPASASFDPPDPAQGTGGRCKMEREVTDVFGIGVCMLKYKATAEVELKSASECSYHMSCETPPTYQCSSTSSCCKQIGETSGKIGIEVGVGTPKRIRFWKLEAKCGITVGGAVGYKRSLSYETGSLCAPCNNQLDQRWHIFVELGGKIGCEASLASLGVVDDLPWFQKVGLTGEVTGCLAAGKSSLEGCGMAPNSNLVGGAKVEAALKGGFGPLKISPKFSKITIYQDGSGC